MICSKFAFLQSYGLSLAYDKAPANVCIVLNNSKIVCVMNLHVLVSVLYIVPTVHLFIIINIVIINPSEICKLSSAHTHVWNGQIWESAVTLTGKGEVKLAYK